ncbi:outer membrane beta-barrel protein [Maribacter sp. 2210JD10-5]|uniref:outer membrane beta-barrel protein n=1 Tax=Maribacter sp. 2210JD10-5 TaxID=3386272 RepID=UPI0039BD2D1F
MVKKLLHVLFLFTFYAQGQVIYVELGQSISQFDYENSVGGTLNNLQSGTNTFLGLGYKIPLKADKASIIIGGLWSNYSAIGGDTRTDSFFEWDVTYAGLNFGLDYKFARSKEFVFFIKVTTSAEYLLRGTQTVNNQVFGLNGEDEFDNFLVVPRLGIGVQYPLSNTAVLYAQYQYGISFPLVNGNPDDDEKLNIVTHNIGIGITIKLPGCNCSL